MYLSGKKPAEISREKSIPVQSIYTIINRYKQRGTVETPKRPRRPHKLTSRNIRALKFASKRERRATLAELADGNPGKPCITIARQVLRDMDIHNRIARKKPYLKHTHITNRLKFAKTYVNHPPEFWKRVIFSDESMFEVGKNYRQIRVWREPGEEYDPSCLAPTSRSGRSSVMIWGAFAFGWKSELLFMEPNERKSADYVRNVYYGPLLKMITVMNSPVLLEDGAPIHRSTEIEVWRANHHLEKLKWPTQSPDLNPH